MGSIYYPRNGLLTYDYEHILIFKKYEGNGRKVDLIVKELSKISLSEWKKWFVGHWKFPGVIQKEHVAMYPEELPYRIIRMFSFIGDTVLDPFLGSGTSLKVAKSLFRKSIGYELNKNFEEIIKSKIREGKADYFKDYQYLLYYIHEKSKIMNFEIDFSNQKQKGIIFLKNDKNSVIAIDYILLEQEILNNVSLKNEIEIKMKENTIQSYFKEKKNWKEVKNYIIIINSKSEQIAKLKEMAKPILDYEKTPKKIQIFSFNEFIKEEFQILNLFQ